jgi:hypothetical protein
MKIHGYVNKGSKTGEIMPVELTEITLVAAPTELRRIAKFLENCANGMETQGKSWEHEHLSDRDQLFQNSPHFIVFNPEYGQ